MIKQFLQVLQNCLGGMTEGPRPLRAHLAFHGSQMNPPVNLTEDDLASMLRSAAPGDPMLETLRRKLIQWDFDQIGAWSNETTPNSNQRRELIYEKLEIDEVLGVVLREKMPPFVQEEPVVVIAEDHELWYAGGDASISDFYWKAYSEYLRNVNGWPEESIQELHESTCTIMERISAPWRLQQYQSKGLVVGYVQSGKTANFTAVLAKAADAGYRLFIVLAGTTKILRAQTQRRIDKELLLGALNG